MSMQDTLSDMLTRMRNGQAAGKDSVRVVNSRLNAAVCGVLHDEGYIAGWEKETEDGKPVLRIDLKWHEGCAVIRELTRVSRPGLRYYARKDELPEVKAGLGITIVSTSKGVMSGARARASGLGGEVLCKVF